MFLTKIDNVDTEEYKTSMSIQLILSFLSGLAFYITSKTGSNIYLGVFYMIFEGYLVLYKIMYRLKSQLNSTFRIQTIVSLVYVCLTFTFLI
jgi:hypothetical protein